ncbi:MAG: hypothetical protein MJZ76_00570 [Bacteroidales bacterium]|nr:hypothetical protein [Bacteroidales bacterium]
MKKLKLFLLAALMGVLVVACGSKETTTDTVVIEDESAAEETSTEISEETSDETIAVDEVETEEVAESDSEDWDAILDEYDEYVTSYLKLYKKAMNGDMDAMTEYAEILSDAESLSSKLAAAQGSMTSAQAARYAKITKKMTNL